MEYLYDNEGKLIQEVLMNANDEHPIIQLERGQRHSFKYPESGTIIVEVKDGAYAPLISNDILYKQYYNKLK